MIGITYWHVHKLQVLFKLSDAETEKIKEEYGEYPVLRLANLSYLDLAEKLMDVYYNEYQCHSLPTETLRQEVKGLIDFSRDHVRTHAQIPDKKIW